MDAAQYLRKSRMEEGMDTEEVLAKHRKALTTFAAAHDIHIIETYYEGGQRGKPVRPAGDAAAAGGRGGRPV